MKKLIGVLIVFLFFLSPAYNQTLIINEVSNGPSGNQEYIELVVADTVVSYNCNLSAPPCIDIRGWIIDDNSGYHGAAGVAAGAVRFSQSSLWSCVPLGTIIVIYNSADKNSSIGAVDTTLNDNNCSIVAPITSNLFQTNTTTPGAVACSYPNTGWINGGNWNNTVLANTGDCARIVNLAGCEVFSLCYGSANTNTLIYFSGSGQDRVYYFNNGNPSLQINWSSGCAGDIAACGGNIQTPGLPNNASNAAFIGQFNNQCTPITPVSVSVSKTDAGCNCTGTAAASASGSIAGYQFTWLNNNLDPFVSNASSVSGLCPGAYYVVATSSIGCSDTASIIISGTSGPSLEILNDTICKGDSTVLTATANPLGGTYSWNTGSNVNAIQVSPLSTTMYTVIYNQGGCNDTAFVQVFVKNNPSVTVNSPQLCTGNQASLVASGANQYSWNTTQTSSGIVVNPLSTSYFTVIGETDGCRDTAVSTVTVFPKPVVNVLNDSICVGESAFITASGANTYSWSNGLNGNTINVSPNSTTQYTVIGFLNSCSDTSVALVSVSPLPILTVTNPVLCKGDNALITAGGAYAYSWNAGDTSSTIIVNPMVNSTYTFIGYNQNCYDTLVSQVQVLDKPDLVVTSDTICLGESVFLNVSGAYTYSWNNGSTSNHVLVTPNVSTQYSVIGKLGLCSDTGFSSVIVNPIPQISFTADTVCEGDLTNVILSGADNYVWNIGSIQDTLQLTASSLDLYEVVGNLQLCYDTIIFRLPVKPLPSLSVVNPSICRGDMVFINAIGADSYSWSNGNLNSFIQVSPTSNTSYTVFGEKDGCLSFAVSMVNVKNTPLINVNSDTICIGQTETINATGANIYSWSNGFNSSSISVSPLVNTNYTVIGFIGDCSDTAISIISVNNNPVLSINDTAICRGDSVSLLIMGADSYEWSNGQTGNNIMVSPLVLTEYTVTGSLNNCTDTAFVKVNVYNPPNVSTTNTAVCIGDSVSIVAVGALNYSWSNGMIGDQISISPVTSVYFTVIGSDGRCSDTAISYVSVKPIPVLNLNDTSVCFGENIIIDADGADNYVWETGAVGNSLSINANQSQFISVIGFAEGCSAVDSAYITVINSPSIMVNNTNVCLGDTILISASGADSYSWSTGELTPAISVYPLTNTFYTLIGELNACYDTLTFELEVLNKPDVKVISSEICKGQNAQLIASGAANYSWSNGSLDSIVVVNPILNTQYTVYGYTDNCYDTAIAMVNVNLNPVVFVKNDTICEGSEATLIATGADSYLWSNGSTLSSISISPSSTNIYSVIGYINQCTDTTLGLVVVKSKPVITTNNPLVCAGSNVVLTAAGSSQYFWSNGLTNSSIVVSPNVNTVFTVIGFLDGCSDTAYAQVTVKEKPKLSDTTLVFCKNDSLNYFPVGADSYIWPDGTNAASSFLSDLNAPFFNLIGIKQGCSDTAVINLNLRDYPSIKSLILSNKACSPVCASFTDLTTSSQGMLKEWKWIINGDTLWGPNQQYCFQSAGNYPVVYEVENEFGCKASQISNHTIQMFEKPNADFYYFPNNLNELTQNITIINTTANAINYSWSINDSLFSNMYNPSINNLDTGIYAITLIASSKEGCSDTTIKYLEIKKAFTFYIPNSFTPNGDYSNYLFKPIGIGWKEDGYHFLVYDRWGMLMFETRNITEGWDGSFKNNNVPPIDVYVWKIKLVDVFNRDHHYQGVVTLLR
jgi:gliding motility-associated-like protein